MSITSPWPFPVFSAYDIIHDSTSYSYEYNNIFKYPQYTDYRFTHTDTTIDEEENGSSWEIPIATVTVQA